MYPHFLITFDAPKVGCWISWRLWNTEAVHYPSQKLIFSKLHYPSKNRKVSPYKMKMNGWMSGWTTFCRSCMCGRRWRAKRNSGESNKSSLSFVQEVLPNSENKRILSTISGEQQKMESSKEMKISLFLIEILLYMRAKVGFVLPCYQKALSERLNILKSVFRLGCNISSPLSN